MGTGSVIDLQILGAGGVPATGVSAVVLNATATNTATQGFFTLYPSLTTRPLASNVNWAAGWTLPNRVIVGVGTNGKVSIYNGQGAADAVIDVSGYFTNATAAGKFFTPLTPSRVVDTRISGGTIGANGLDTFQVTGGSVPTGATAVFINTTVTNTTAPSALTVFPGPTRPTASDLNWVAGQTIPNLTLATLSSTGTSSFFNFVGSTDLVLDLSGYFGGAATGVTVSANPATIPADGATTSVITATVIRSDGTPAISDPVNFTTSGAACGTLTGTNPTTTNASGQATITYVAGTTAGTCTITATETNLGVLSGSTGVAQTAVKNKVVVSPVATQSAGSTTPVTVTTTVTQGFTGGGPVNADTVNFTLSGGAACGTLSATSGATNTSGVVTTNYTPSSTIGFCTFTSTETATGGTGTTTITQKGSGGANCVIATPCTLTGAPATVPADGTTTSTITVQVGGPSNFNDPISLSTSGATGVCGTLSATTGTTDGTGKLTGITYTPTTVGGICTINAIEANSGGTFSGTVTQTPQTNTVALTAVPNPVVGNGTSTSTLTATVTRQFGGAAVAGDSVAFSMSGAACTGATLGTPSGSPAGTTDANGVVTIKYTTSIATGFCTVTATDTVKAADVLKYASGGFKSVTITQTAGGAASAISVVASPASIPADGTVGASTVTATVTNGGGTAVQGDMVSFAVSGSACGTNAPATTTTDANGKATYAFTATAAGSCTVTATEASAGLSNSATITETAVKNVVGVTAVTNPIAAGSATADVITAHVTRKVGGANVQGDTIAWTTSGGAACGTLSTATGTTDSGGLATTSYTATATIGFCTITATDTSSTPTTFASGGVGTLTITQKGGATNCPLLPPTCSVTGAPASVPADGTSTSTITVQVTGTAAFNDPISLSTSGATGVCGTLSATTGTTDGTGKLTGITYTATTIGGICTISAQEANGGATPFTGTVTQTPQKNTVSLTAVPNPVQGNGTNTVTLTATVTRQFGGGAAVAGDTVTFTLSGAACTGAVMGTSSGTPPGTTDANGQVTVKYTTSVGSGFCTVTATDSALAAADAGKYATGGTASVTIIQS
jgi:adhesin/invasin